jgi:hypothetical protein
MSIVVKKVTDKNTKKQILEEYEKAMKLINELKSNLKSSGGSISKTAETVNVKESKFIPKDILSVDGLVNNFNSFSNRLKEDMSAEIKVIEELKKQIDEKIESIKRIYDSESSVLLEDLISRYNKILKEQEEAIAGKKRENEDKIEQIEDAFDNEKEKHSALFFKRKNAFKLNKSRLEKSDGYAKEKANYALSLEQSLLLENNQALIDDLEQSYKSKNQEAYQVIEEEEMAQSERIKKAELHKEKFEQTVTAKVTSIVTKEKSANAQAYKSMTEEFENKIKLKRTQLENFEAENRALELQIEELLGELNTVQEKAHILASKTIDANSSTQSFEAMREVAMEQARGKK